MLALSDIIDFLLGLLRDEDARASFDQDPHTALAQAGLGGVTAQDMRDAQLRLADSGVAQPVAHAAHYAGGDDPVREISHTAHHFHVAHDVPDTVTGAVITIDDRDTVINQTSFDSHDQLTVIEDSFNHVDVTNVDAVDSFNSSVDNDVVAIQDNDVTTIDNNVLAIQDNDTITQVTEPAPGAVGGGSLDPVAADPPLVDDGLVDSGPADLGSAEPGSAEAGPADTDPTDPGPDDLGTDDPGPDDLGTDDPSALDSGHEPLDAIPEPDDPSPALDPAAVF